MKLFKFITLAVMAIAAIMAQAQDVPVESIQILVNGNPATSGKLAVQGTRTLTVSITPENATNKNVEWSTSDASVAAFVKDSPGKIRGMKTGDAVITASIGNVKAEYTVAVSQKDAKIGQVFFSNNSWEDAGFVEGKTPVGVIFYLNPDKRSGKIVSLDEAPTLKWSTDAAPSPNAFSVSDGQANLAKIQAVPNWKELFDAEAWCVDKNSDDLLWYLPASDELRQLYAASCGLTWVESGATGDKEINNWTVAEETMVPGELRPYAAEREKFNAILEKVKGTPLAEDKYWSSTESQLGVDASFAEFVSFEGGFYSVQPKQYFHICKTRAVATFSIEGSVAGVEDVVSDDLGTPQLEIRYSGDRILVNSTDDIKSVEVYTVSGASVPAKTVVDGSSASVNVNGLVKGTYIVVARTASGVCSGKIVK